MVETEGSLTESVFKDNEDNQSFETVIHLEKDELSVYKDQKCILIGNMKILLSCEGNNNRALLHVKRYNVGN